MKYGMAHTNYQNACGTRCTIDDLVRASLSIAISCVGATLTLGIFFLGIYVTQEVAGYITHPSLLVTTVGKALCMGMGVSVTAYIATRCISRTYQGHHAIRRVREVAL